MLTKKLTYRLLSCMLACYASLTTSFAQDSLLLRDYRFVRQADPWLIQRNTAALTRFASNNIVTAEAALNYSKGKLVDFYDSPDVLQGNVAIESLYRLNQHTVLYGGISYDNWSGRDMTGSAFMHLSPLADRYPFDIVEDSLTNAGKKHRDTYRLTGGFGIDIYRGISVGVRLDYTAANYAKYKDLRHKNKLTDLLLTAGVYAPVTRWLSFGADYTYHRNTETLQFSTNGKSEKVYKSLIDYGAMMGLVEQAGNEGYTDKSQEMPLFEDSHGGSFQLGLQPLDNLTAYASIGFSHGTGYYGRKSPYTITYTRHSRDILELSAALVYQRASSRHRLDVSYTTEKLNNKAETWRDMTNESQATYYEYYDPVETADKKWKETLLTYTADLGIQGELPTWTFEVGYRWMQRRQVAYLFPFYRYQQLTSNGVNVCGTHNLLTRHGVWSFSINASYQKGSGAPYIDGTFVTTSNKQQEPATMEAFLYREYRYLTAPQYKIGGSAKYTFRFPGTRIATYAKLNILHHHATEGNDYTCGNNRSQTAIAIGCTF